MENQTTQNILYSSTPAPNPAGKKSNPRTKLFIFIFAFLFVLLTTGTIILNKSRTSQISPSPTAFETPDPVINRNENELPIAQIDVGEQLAQAETVNISGFSIKNFYKERVVTAPNGDVLFHHGDGFEFSYLPGSEMFLITITDTPVDEKIQSAQTEFLRVLEIGSNTACRLNVQIGVPGYVDESLGGETFRFDFCT